LFFAAEINLKSSTLIYIPDTNKTTGRALNSCATLIRLRFTGVTFGAQGRGQSYEVHSLTPSLIVRPQSRHVGLMPIVLLSVKYTVVFVRSRQLCNTAILL